MNEICQIRNFYLSNVKILFCSLCNNLMNTKSKKCQNNKCKIIICEDCYNKNKNDKCPKCQNGQLSDFSISSLQIVNEILFFCSKSIKCKEKYSLEEFQANHLHKDDNQINCINCNQNLYNSPNVLNCVSCKNYFHHKNINYVPMLTKNIKDSNKNCGTRCVKCYKPICNKCNQNNYKNIICKECNYKCQICSKNNSETICESCDKMICNSCAKICKKCSTTLCITDHKSECKKHQIKINKNQKCSICKTNKYQFLCSICHSNICFSKCLNICNISSCKNIICVNCSLFCNICKEIICKNCAIQCSNCPKTNSLISCKDCNSDIIMNCSMKNCNTKSCIKCANFCNYCREVNCKTHSLSCINCKETICKFHWHMCKNCNNNPQEKLCLKNCTYRCNFCLNEINALCKEENHINDFCKKYPCGHYVCNSCTQKCDNCKIIIQGCSECEIEKKFVSCRLCNKCLCFDCSRLCIKCNENYCNGNHKCYLCSKTIENNICPNCDLISKSRCIVCSKGLNQCDICFRNIICSLNCYLNYIKNNDFDSIKKDKGFKRSYTIQNNKNTNIKSNIANNMLNTGVNLFNKDNGKEKDKKSTINNNHLKSEIFEREKHLCLMYWCEEHIGINFHEKVTISINDLNDIIRKDLSSNIQKNKITNDNQSSIKCSSCIVI